MKRSILTAAFVLLPSVLFRWLFPGIFFIEVQLSKAFDVFFPGEFICEDKCQQRAARIREALLILPRRRLSADELREYDRDGVAVLRSVITDQWVLNALRNELWTVANKGLKAGDDLRQKAQTWNAGVRALVNDTLLSTLAASASNVSGPDVMQLEENPVWGVNGSSEQKFNDYHYDDKHPVSRDGKCVMVTIWLSLTDSPEPLHFVKWSHVKRKDIMSSDCASWFLNMVIPTSFAKYDRACIQKFMDDAGYPASRFSAVLKPGDAFIFNGDTLHSTTFQRTGRLGIAMRFRPDFPDEECYSGVPEMWTPPGVTPIVSE